MRRSGPAWLITALLLAVVAWLVADRDDRKDPRSASAWEVADLLGGQEPGFDRVTGSGPFTFPRDHGPHPGYRHEWWYLTGHLADADGRRYGFQWTLFRFGLTADLPDVPRPSAWRSDAIYMAHFAVTDVADGRFHAAERFARPALGLAGARAVPFAAWLGPWRLSAATGAAFPWRLEAADDGVALDVRLVPTKPVIAQGDDGTSRKGPGPGNASRYYTLPRLSVEGALHLAGERRAVTGSAWLDREWGSSALGPGVVGWDWFGLQLDDGRDLMLYRLRRADGTTDPFSGGSLVGHAGRKAPLAAADFSIEVRERWRAPDGVAYPSRWRVRVPAHGLDLDVRPVLAAQELRLAVRYWEGAVEVGGSVGGRGYAELTGYAESGGAAPPR